MLRVLDDLIQNGLGGLIAIEYEDFDSDTVAVAWRQDTRLGQLGDALEAYLKVASLADDTARSPDLHAKDIPVLRETAVQHLARATKLAAALTDEERIIVTHLGGPVLKAFVSSGVTPT